MDDISDSSHMEAANSHTPLEGNECEDIIDNGIGNEELDISVDSSFGSTSEPVQCHICNKIYKNKKSLATHLRVKHKTALTIRSKMPCLEVNCDFRGSRIASLISHLITAHKKKFQCEKVTFQSQEEFWKWKKKAEDCYRSSYIASTAAKELVSGDKKFFLRCNRSGYARSKSSTNIGKSSTSKSNLKINAVCTSLMNVKFHREGGAFVFFCKTHYGHKQDHMFRYNRLTEYERNMIKGLILEGLTASEIVPVMKTQMPEHRHHLLKYSNIRDISMKQSLLINKDKNVVKRHSEMEKDISPLPYKSCDFLMDLNVDNEVEIETGNEVSEISSLMIHSVSDDIEAFQNTECNTIEKLRNDVLDKGQQISRLASKLISEASLNTLNRKLNSILKDTKGLEFVEVDVIPDTVEAPSNCDKNDLMFEDPDGHSVHMVCANKDMN